MNNLSSHLDLFPSDSTEVLLNLSADYSFELKASRIRNTKLGDFRYPINGERPVITLNRDPNTYRVLITFLHELAHLITFLEVGRNQAPHGPKWKKRFAHLLDIVLQSNVFPDELSEAVIMHIEKPKASTHADIKLLNTLRKFDTDSEKILLEDLDKDQLFEFGNGRVFRKLEKRRTRVLCKEIASGKKYLIHAHAEVRRVE